MALAPIQRKLAAILAADVVGYSRLMEADEAGTLSGVKAVRQEVIDPGLARFGGRIFKNTGDGLLAEFPSAVNAVECAVGIQRALAQRNDEVPTDRRIDFRVGISLGDVIVDGEDLYGNGVNVAARMEGLADPGSICISGNVQEHLKGIGEIGLEDLGTHTVKNIAQPINVYRVLLAPSADAPARAFSRSDQVVRFCKAKDGVQIAYATIGQGPPLVKAAQWLSHLEYDWESPVHMRFLQELAAEHFFVRYDERGTSLSDWDVPDISFEAFVSDLEAVADAAGLDRFSLLGYSHGCPVAVAYAVRHPERVHRLVLYGGFIRGRARRADPQMVQQLDAIRTLILQGWAQDNPAFRQIFTAQMMPDGDPEQFKWFNDLQRVSTSPENAARIRDAINQIDVSDLLERVTQPTVILHRRGDAAAPFEESRRMAALIPDARFIALEGRNHAILPHETEWQRFMSEITNFLRA